MSFYIYETVTGEPLTEKQRLEVEIYHLRIAMKIAARNIDRKDYDQAKKNLDKALERED